MPPVSNFGRSEGGVLRKSGLEIKIASVVTDGELKGSDEIARSLGLAPPPHVSNFGRSDALVSRKSVRCVDTFG